MAFTAADIIARLELRPHPEGGHYRETFRDAGSDAQGRSRSTVIYYLLRRSERWGITSWCAHAPSGPALAQVATAVRSCPS